MRSRILVTIAATSLLVLIAFLVPLWYLVRSFAVERAQNNLVVEVQPLVAALAFTPAEEIKAAVEDFNSTAPHPVSVIDAKGKISGPPWHLDDSAKLALRDQRAVFVESVAGLALIEPIASDSGPAVLRAILPPEELANGVSRARAALLGLGIALLGLAIVVGNLLAGSFLRPIADLSHTAEQLASGDLSSRVDPGGPPEIRNVGQLLNRLAGRISELLRGERESVADLAHRLRTPVTALRLDVDSLTSADERSRLTDSVDRLEVMVDHVIREARRPVREGVKARCDAATVVRDRVGFWKVLADEQSRHVSSEISVRPCPVRIDSMDLGDALDALLGNVFAHTPEGSAFAVHVHEGPGLFSTITVEDAGPGLPHHGVLDRGHSRTGSTGLGLDIARRTAEASGGELTIGQSDLGGASITLLLGRPTD